MKMQRNKGLFVLIVPLFCFFLGSCGASLTPSASSTEVTSLHVSRTDSNQNNNITSFAPKIDTNMQEVQNFYRFLYTLPKAPQHSKDVVISCLMRDFTYHLRFLHKTSEIYAANIQGGNCSNLVLGYDDHRLITDEFWKRLASILHVSPQTLYSPYNVMK